MSEAAITLPLDIVERLLKLAKSEAFADVEAIDLVEREIAQVKALCGNRNPALGGTAEMPPEKSS